MQLSGGKDANKIAILILKHMVGIVQMIQMILKKHTSALCSIMQCFGSVTYWYGSGSAPLTNRFGSSPGSGSSSGSCSFRQWLSRRQQKYFFSTFFCLLLSKVHLYHSSKIKSHKKVSKSRNQGFYSMMEGPKFESMTNGSGSGWSKKLKGSETLVQWQTKCLFYHMI